MSPHRAHSWVAEFQSHNRGHRNTRLFPSNMFNVLCYIPCIKFLPASSYCYSSSPYAPSSLFPVRCRLWNRPCAHQVQSLLIPPSHINSCPRPPHPLFAEVQNCLRHDLLCDCIITLQDMISYLLTTRLLHCCLQMWVQSAPTLPLLWMTTHYPPRNPVMETSQGLSHAGGQHPRLQPKTQVIKDLPH